MRRPSKRGPGTELAPRFCMYANEPNTINICHEEPEVGKNTKNMTFTGIEMAAISKLALTMAAADGKLEKNELTYIALELGRFGVKDATPILKGAEEMDPTIALSIVSKMSSEEKKYVTAYLGALMAVDGEIDEKELALWNLTSSLCNLPTMNISDAIKYVQNM